MPVERGPYLFKFDGSEAATSRERAFDIFAQDHGAPEILNLNGFNRKKPDLGLTSIIDVVTDFEWTHTPAHGRHEVPFLRMSEYRVNFNSLLQNIRYLLHSVQNETLKEIETQFAGVGPAGLGGELVNVGTKALRQLKDAIKNNVPGLFGMSHGNTANHLIPYYGLYGASPSGFEYYLPYFEQNWKTVDGNWQDWSQGGGPLKQVYNNLFSKDGFLKSIASGLLLSPNALGTQIDRPKQYVYEKDSPAITVKFDLMNTTNMDDIVKNWQLIFLLLYQNLPNKTSKIQSEPPVIYEVEIPGTFYSPFAYIQSIRILNRGATRIMEIPVAFTKNSDNIPQSIDSLDIPNQTGEFNNITKKSSGRNVRSNFSSDSQAAHLLRGMFDLSAPENRVQVMDDHVTTGISPADINYIKTLIPDAFSVEITLQSLVPESKNLLFHSLLGRQGIKTGIFTATGQPGSGMLPDGKEDGTITDLINGIDAYTKETAEGPIPKPTGREEGSMIGKTPAQQRAAQKRHNSRMYRAAGYNYPNLDGVPDDQLDRHIRQWLRSNPGGRVPGTGN